MSEHLIVLRDRLVEEFEEQSAGPYRVSWEIFMLGRVAALEAKLEAMGRLIRRCRSALGPLTQDDNEECIELVDALDAVLAAAQE